MMMMMMWAVDDATTTRARAFEGSARVRGRAWSRAVRRCVGYSRGKAASACAATRSRRRRDVAALNPVFEWVRACLIVIGRGWGLGNPRARARVARVTRARSCAFARVGARSHHVRLVSRARARWVRARRARTRVIRDRAMVVHAMWRARMRARIRRARASANRTAARARACERFFFSRRFRAHRCRAPSSRPRSRIARRAKNAPVESRASRDAL